jgi:hypothetical protein
MARKPRVLAIASGGGHWVQLLRVAPAFEGCDTCFVTVRRTYRDDIKFGRFRTIVDATRWNKIKLARMALKIALIVLLERPDVVISTGAAPGYFAFRFARLLGARTIWLDSIANAEVLSMTGKMVKPYADLWLTQWSTSPHRAAPLIGGVWSDGKHDFRHRRGPDGLRSSHQCRRRVGQAASRDNSLRSDRARSLRAPIDGMDEASGARGLHVCVSKPPTRWSGTPAWARSSPPSSTPKPVLIMPRRGDRQETRNDHQVATAERFGSKPGVLVAMDEGDIARKLDTILSADRPDPLGNTASTQLVESIRRFIHSAGADAASVPPPVR